MYDIYECPVCSKATRWYTNERLIAGGWAWRWLENGSERRIVCDECAEKMPSLIDREEGRKSLTWGT